jgi:nitrous oxide reductase accessory protein NosL
VKLSKILMLTVLALVLAACSVSTKSVSPLKPPQIARPDSALLRLCALPMDIGKGPLTQAQVEDLWITDRSALLACYRRHLALRNFVIERDDALRGEGS